MSLHTRPALLNHMVSERMIVTGCGSSLPVVLEVGTKLARQDGGYYLDCDGHAYCLDGDQETLLTSIHEENCGDD